MIFHNVEQNTDEWMALRTGLVTMSKAGTFMANFGKAFGDPAKDYALQIALERVTGKKSEHGFKNDHMERGQMQEPIARMLYEEQNFTTVLNGGFFELEGYGDSPDGLIGDDGVLEIKSVIPTTHYANLRRNAIDPAYKWQIIGHLDCTGRNWVDFASYCSDFPEEKQLIVYRTHRNDVLEELGNLRSRRNQFLQLVSEIQKQIAS